MLLTRTSGLHSDTNGNGDNPTDEEDELPAADLIDVIGILISRIFLFIFCNILISRIFLFNFFFWQYFDFTIFF